MRQRKFGGVKFRFFQHPLKHFTRSQDLDLKIDPVRANTTIDEGPRAVVVPTDKGELNLWS